MIPSVDLRLASMIRTIRDVILPALAHDGFAGEQAKLILGHLHVLRGQIDVIPEYEWLEWQSTVALAAELDALAARQGQDDAGPAAAHLAGLLAEARAVAATDREGVRSARAALNAAIDRLVAEAAGGDAAFKATVIAKVVAAQKAAAERGRALFQATGFEGADAALPAVDAMMADFRAS